MNNQFLAIHRLNQREHITSLTVIEMSKSYVSQQHIKKKQQVVIFVVSHSIVLDYYKTQPEKEFNTDSSLFSKGNKKIINIPTCHSIKFHRYEYLASHLICLESILSDHLLIQNFFENHKALKKYIDILERISASELNCLKIY